MTGPVTASGRDLRTLAGIVSDDRGEPLRSLAGLETLPHPMLEQRLQRGQVLAADPPRSQRFEIKDNHAKSR